MPTIFKGPPSKATRNKPIAPELKQVLEKAAAAGGIEVIVITSGGQDPPGRGSRRTGSTRHDHGRAADLQCVVNGKTLSFTDEDAPAAILAFVTAAAAAGANGIGAGVGYMGNRTIHVGFGKTPEDHERLTWGARGQSAAAPRWLREAAQAGWSAATPGAIRPQPAARGASSRHVVMARSGLKLRGGPGTAFGSERTLPAGTELVVLGADQGDPAWVRVDLEADGLADGYVFGAYLAPVGEGATAPEGVPEPE